MSAGGALRLGLVGCGRLAELGYVPAIAGLADVGLTALADPDPERRATVARLVAAREPAPRTHASVAELLAGGEVDAVIVASPAAEHVWQAELACRAGIPCLVEKPPAPNLAGARRLAGLSPAPWVGFNRRFAYRDSILAAADAQGPLELELELSYRRASWRALVVDDPALLDLAPHLVDLALIAFGRAPVRVRSATFAASRAEISLESERGRAMLRCASDRAHRERVIIRDRQGRTLARGRAGGPLAAIGGWIAGRDHPLVGSLRDQVAAFASVARGDRPAELASAADGARVMAVIDEALVLASGGTRPA